MSTWSLDQPCRSVPMNLLQNGRIARRLLDPLPPYSYEHESGGGGGPIQVLTSSPVKGLVEPLPGHSHEPCSGGGGGQSMTGRKMKPAFPLPGYEHEAAKGGGGGKDEEIPIALYEVAHRINPSKKGTVSVTVNVKCSKSPLSSWTQDTDFDERNISRLRVVDDSDKKIDYEFNETSVIIKPKGNIIKAFRMDYEVSHDNFFATINLLEDGKCAFQYMDLFRCDNPADTFSVSFNYPNFLQIDAIRPIPFSLRGTNEIYWELSQAPASKKFKVRLMGNF